VSLFEVTPNDIRQLGDDELADLLGRLVEAEALDNGIPLSAVTYGGHGNAADDGVDARISWSGSPDHTDFFARRTTVFQSKAETMSAKPLKDEMAPGSKPRPLFQELAEEDGAYVMFCGKDNCNDQMLRDRKSAMLSVVSPVSQADRLGLDFYDASRIARWVNTHTGVAVWLRDNLGRQLQGWRPYEPWSRSDATEPLSYLADETPRAAFTFTENAPQVSILEALQCVRSELATPRRSVRLVGLSGTGKTRFAEALFDNEVGTAALPTSRVIYGDIASAEVSPANVAEQLIADGRPAIMIADNCPATVHRQVSKIITRPNSQISFLSIDYDVGQDQPESTLVVLLTEDSHDLIGALLAQRAPDLPQTDRDRIVEFSGGNGRVALVLLRSAQAAGSLADLTDRDLVRRLFQDDRSPASYTLMRCAEAASLVISYSVEPAEEGADPEYYHLARLAGVPVGDMFRATREFIDRGVGQQRGGWRAVLPHALAARLARQALERIPRAELYRTFAERSSQRLALSFAKRLGQVDDHPDAQAFASMFLTKGGPVGVVSWDDEWKLEMLLALAPAAQQLALDTVERSLDADEAGRLLADKSITRYRIAKLLMQLAYQSDLFNRATLLLTRVVKDEDRDNNQYNVRHLFEQLFWVILSGTLVDSDQRIDLIDTILGNKGDRMRLLGIDALDAALKASMFSSSIDLTKFGGRPREVGCWPTNEQIEQQFARAARCLTKIAVSGDALADRAKLALEHHVRELSQERFLHILEEIAHIVRSRSFWLAGWRQVCLTLHFDGRKMAESTRERLSLLEEMLEPKTLEERFEAFVLCPYWDLYTPYPKDENDRLLDVKLEIEAISRELRGSPDELSEYVRRATRPGQGQASLFGESLMAVGFDPDALYSIGVEAWDGCSSQPSYPGFLFGVLKGLPNQDVARAEEMLDRVAAHQSLRRQLVGLSAIVRPPSARSLRRILLALEADHVEPSSLSWCANGAAHNQLPLAELVRIFEELLRRRREGIAAAANILFYLLSGEQNGIAKLSEEMRAMARRVVASEHFFSSSDTHQANVLAESVLDYSNDCQLASTVVASIRAAIEDSSGRDDSMKDVLCFIAHRFPDVFLNDAVIYSGPQNIRCRFFFENDDDDVRNSVHPIDRIDPTHLIRWVEEDPGTRAGRVAQMLTFAMNRPNDPAEGLVWRPVALDLIGIESTSAQVLREFEGRFYIGSWNGSQAQRYLRRQPLCEALRSHPNPIVTRWAREALHRMAQNVERAEQRERRESQSFE
jgi:hypothetical protein